MYRHSKAHIQRLTSKLKQKKKKKNNRKKNFQKSNYMPSCELNKIEMLNKNIKQKSTTKNT
ncbi:hypothetical protein DERP_002760 [Dermatophagoides pteronyssinus]|uniref:Uncharacterized protein n=1 Tax=Dermatophagoides pteronyssinus TaxID=6956 RepID=A0ABQ8JVM7_DERPT|nr:hypothetical protein DERP_002760 [Dermatophagoides pteronyssinus]